MRWAVYEPLGRDGARAAAVQAYGRNIQARNHFDRAAVVVSLDADFLLHGPSAVRDAHDFIERRQILKHPNHPTQMMNRLYVVESTPSITGARADHRLAVRSSTVPLVALALARALGIAPGFAETPAESTLRQKHGDFITAVAHDLLRNRGAGLITAGEQQSSEVHLLAHAMNHLLCNVGPALPIELTDAVEVRPAGAPVNDVVALAQLVTEMREGQVQTLLIMGGNPVYDAPADLHFGGALSKVARKIHHSLFEVETSAACDWHIPDAHVLESWTDHRAFDGHATIGRARRDDGR